MGVGDPFPVLVVSPRIGGDDIDNNNNFGNLFSCRRRPIHFRSPPHSKDNARIYSRKGREPCHALLRGKKETFILIKFAIFDLMLRYDGVKPFVLVGKRSRLEKTTANDIRPLFVAKGF